MSTVIRMTVSTHKKLRLTKPSKRVLSPYVTFNTKNSSHTIARSGEFVSKTTQQLTLSLRKYYVLELCCEIWVYGIGSCIMWRRALKHNVYSVLQGWVQNKLCSFFSCRDRGGRRVQLFVNCFLSKTFKDVQKRELFFSK